jgi:hypothetical protein
LFESFGGVGEERQCVMSSLTAQGCRVWVVWVVCTQGFAYQRRGRLYAMWVKVEKVVYLVDLYELRVTVCYNREVLSCNCDQAACKCFCMLFVSSVGALAGERDVDVK